MECTDVDHCDRVGEVGQERYEEGLEQGFKYGREFSYENGFKKGFEEAAAELPTETVNNILESLRAELKHLSLIGSDKRDGFLYAIEHIREVFDEYVELEQLSNHFQHDIPRA